MLAHRKLGFSSNYRGHNLQIGHVDPDLIAEVDGVELGAFYLTVAHAYAAVDRHIDALEKAAREKIPG